MTAAADAGKRITRRCAAGRPGACVATVLASGCPLRTDRGGARGPDAAGHAGRVVARRRRAAALGPGPVPSSLGQLSKGTVTGGRLVCPYHGWQFGPDGAVVEIPQLEEGATLPPACLQLLAATEALGMAWISLEPQPHVPVPAIAEFEDTSFDRIEVGVIRYRTSAAAIIDNNTDSTHIAFVHSGSFGADQDPQVEVGSVQRTSFGISISYPEMPIARTPTSQQPGTRWSVTEMWLPFVQVGRMHYSDGSTHILVKGCCPVDDDVTDVHLAVLRNDLAGAADRQSIIDFELAVELEDKAVLETLPATFPLDPRLQAHTRHDRPGIAYRHALSEFLADLS